MKSMTGFAKSQVTVDNKKITIEIRTLNSKQLDINIKAPSNYKEYELTIRTMLNKLGRGKIDLTITDEADSSNSMSLNKTLFMECYEEVKQLATTTGDHIDNTAVFTSLLSKDEMWNGTKEETLSEQTWNIIAKEIERTIDEVDNTRQHEGTILQKDIALHIDEIERNLNNIPQYESERINNIKEHLTTALNELNIREANQERFEQELIYYLEKLDITEEKVRLAKHINYFREVMTQEPHCGKKLSFIAQEMGREINTTGSKANNVDIQKLVVIMKDELEKIKEQLGNIE